MSVPTKVERLLQLARLAIADRDWPRAKLAYLQALAVASDIADIHYGLATVYFQTKELTSAAHHFREVTRLDPTRASAFISLGAVLKVLEQNDDAVAALRRGLQLDPHRTEGYYNLGVVYRLQGKFDLAIQAYKEAIKLNPRMADAHLNLGNLYTERQLWRQAIEHYREALEIRPDWAKAVDGLAHAEAALHGEKPQAETAAPVKKNLTREERFRDIPLDPERHGQFLLDLRRSTGEIEDVARQLIAILEREMEQALKSLSTALLYPDTPRSQIDGCVERFEQALERFHAAHQLLLRRTNHLRDMGEHFSD
jgi:cytochrome c-type biogenesis protein CcmH/NrfG